MVEQNVIPFPAVSTLAQIEAAAIRDALARDKGNVAMAARKLGVARFTLYRKMKLYKIENAENR